MKFFNLVLLSSLILFAAACGKDNKSGSSSDGFFSALNTNGQAPAQSLAQLKSQLNSKDPKAGLAAGQTLDFYQTSVSANQGNWWIFQYTTYSSSSNCERVRVMDINAMTLQVQSGDCSNYTTKSFSYSTYNKSTDPALQAFMNISEGSVTQVRQGTVYFNGVQQPAYLVQVSNGDQYVVAPNLPLLANPVMKKNIYSGDTEGLIGAQVSI
ncbi:MAG: hypothetical protein K2P81_02210 [Bacteriovoracaceae bacterium]|nr:hypothetical protein [Bacteriovoracaceae bacterium]